MSYDFEQRLKLEGTRIIQSDTGGGYDWDLVEVWKRNEDGRYFLYANAGCSCYGPYDEVDSWNDLEPLLNIQQLVAALNNQSNGTGHASRIIDMVAKVSGGLNGSST